MYVFTSFIFFLIFFSFISGSDDSIAKIDRGSQSDSAQHAAKAIIDSNLKGLNASAKKKHAENDSTIDLIGGREDNSGFSLLFNLFEDYRDRKEYDSLLAAGKVDDGFFKRAMVRKKISLKERYGNDRKAMVEKFGESFKHGVPQMFFLSLPLFALFLRLLYVRRKKYYYVAHAIFTIHFYIAVYIISLLALLIAYLSKEFSFLHWMMYLARALIIYIFLYGYKAMRNFYGQGRVKTILKYLLIFFWLIFVILFVMIAMFAFSVYKL